MRDNRGSTIFDGLVTIRDVGLESLDSDSSLESLF